MSWSYSASSSRQTNQVPWVYPLELEPLCAFLCAGGGGKVYELDAWFLGSEKLQNKSSPNFSNFRPEFCPEFCSEFSPNFLKNFRASFCGKRRPETIHQKSPPFFNAKFPGKFEKEKESTLLFQPHIKTHGAPEELLTEPPPNVSFRVGVMCPDLCLPFQLSLSSLASPPFCFFCAKSSPVLLHCPFVWLYHPFFWPLLLRRSQSQIASDRHVACQISQKKNFGVRQHSIAIADFGFSDSWPIALWNSI